MGLQVPESISVEVIYPLAHKQEIFSLKVPVGTTVRQAIEASGILRKYPEIDLAKNKLGVFAKLTKQRAAEGKVMKKGAGEQEGE